MVNKDEYNSLTTTYHRWPQKSPTEQNAISRQPIELLPKFQDLQRKGFLTVLENFTDIHCRPIFIASRITAFTIFIQYFNITSKKWTVTWQPMASLIESCDS